MSQPTAIKIGALRPGELQEANRIVRLAFGTFLRMPDPMQFMGDRDFITPRFRAPHVKMIAAREKDRLIGTNVLTRWGSFAFFGPLTILPDYWDRGVAQRLLEATIKAFDAWGVRHTGLFTFPHSAKHVALYQKFGYWPRHLTAIMQRTPENTPMEPVLLSAVPKPRRAEALHACARLTHKIDRGLDLTEEIASALKQGMGDVVLTSTRNTLDSFAVCMHGPGSEGGQKICYIKFAAARGGDAFSRLLQACDAFALQRAATIEAGMTFANEDAYRRMRACGYRATAQGVAMHRPNADGFNRPDAYVVGDWR